MPDAPHPALGAAGALSFTARPALNALAQDTNKDELVTISQVTALGVLLSNAHSFADAPTLLAVMIVILVIGMVVDGVFTVIARAMRRRRGLGTTRL